MGCAGIRKAKDPHQTMNSPLKIKIPKPVNVPKGVFFRANFKNSLGTIYEARSYQEVSYASFE